MQNFAILATFLVLSGQSLVAQIGTGQLPPPTLGQPQPMNEYPPRVPIFQPGTTMPVVPLENAPPTPTWVDAPVVGEPADNAVHWQKSNCQPTTGLWGSLRFIYGFAEGLGNGIDRDQLLGGTTDIGYWLGPDRSEGLLLTLTGVRNIEEALIPGIGFVSSPLTVVTADPQYLTQLGTLDRTRVYGLIGGRFGWITESAKTTAAASYTQRKALNIIYAGEMGILTDWNFGPYGAGFLFKVGVGHNDRSWTTNGVRVTDSGLIYIPEVGFRTSYGLGDGVRCSLGINFQYYSEMARPDELIANSLWLATFSVGVEWRF
ncbi:MAG: hypothetical protein R3B84_12400 [Zavarzinella sp.]